MIYSSEPSFDLANYLKGPLLCRYDVFPQCPLSLLSLFDVRLYCSAKIARGVELALFRPSHSSSVPTRALGGTHARGKDNGAGGELGRQALYRAEV
jgi:hypothetical protein